MLQCVPLNHNTKVDKILMHNDIIPEEILYRYSRQNSIEVIDNNDTGLQVIKMPLLKFDNNLVSELEYKGLELQNLSNKLQVKVAKYNLINATNAYYYAALGDITIS